LLLVTLLLQRTYTTSGTGVWSMGTLSNGAGATLTITATVNATVVMPIQRLLRGNGADPAMKQHQQSTPIYPAISTNQRKHC
jgi:hypothetical protein